VFSSSAPPKTHKAQRSSANRPEARKQSQQTRPKPTRTRDETQPNRDKRKQSQKQARQAHESKRTSKPRDENTNTPRAAQNKPQNTHTRTNERTHTRKEARTEAGRREAITHHFSRKLNQARKSLHGAARENRPQAAFCAFLRYFRKRLFAAFCTNYEKEKIKIHLPKQKEILP